MWTIITTFGKFLGLIAEIKFKTETYFLKETSYKIKQ